MNSVITNHQQTLEQGSSTTDRWAKSFFCAVMTKISVGQITLQETNYRKTFGDDPTLSATIIVLDPRFYKKVLFGGTVGAGEAYIDKLWEVDNLTRLIRIMVLNMNMVEKLERRFSLLLYPYLFFSHLLRRNSKKGARRNILSHYDLGNDMYKSFLDPTMMYSSAIYSEKHQSLEKASLHKLDIICQELNLKPSDRVVEIGAGWCGFAIYAARNYGCHVTTTTISDAQYQEGKKRIAQAGLEEKITLLKKDYRDLSGKFDKLVSIEMIEAVGHGYHAHFFSQCEKLLKKDGKMLIQSITISDQRYNQHIHGADFTQQHIFPGGCLLSNKRMLDIITDNTDFVVRKLRDFGFDYARTLKAWRKRFNQAYPILQKRGYDESFKRLWNFYLSYCEGGFKERLISVVHLVATRPENRDQI